MSAKKILVTLFSILLLGGVSYAQRSETIYSYTGSIDLETRPSISAEPRMPEATLEISTETRYNAKGTTSSSKNGLISTRRDQVEFAAFLLGMQDSSIRMGKTPLNVAPITARTLQEQVDVLSKRGVEIFLVDAPDPTEITPFIKSSEFVQRKFALISKTLPRGVNPPVVVDTPIMYGERVGEAAIRLVGNNAVQVAYVLDEVNEDLSIRDLKEGILQTFEKPFKNVAPEIELTKLDLNAYTESLTPPEVVCILSPEDSKKWALKLRSMFPDARLICVGESPEVISAYNQGLIDIRVRPDYDRIYSNAIREVHMKSQMPIILQKAADRQYWEKKESKEN